jgi:hypothetical protein
MLSLTVGHAGVQWWQWRWPTDARSLMVAQTRNNLSGWLRGVLVAALLLLACGVLDLVSWWLLGAWLAALDAPHGGTPSWLWGGLGVGGFALLVLRNLVQPLQQMAAETSKQGQDWAPRLVNLAN